jgi:hypothetical protein
MVVTTSYTSEMMMSIRTFTMQIQGPFVTVTYPYCYLQYRSSFLQNIAFFKCNKSVKKHSSHGFESNFKCLKYNVMCDLKFHYISFSRTLHATSNNKPSFQYYKPFTLLNHHPTAVRCSAIFIMTNILVNATQMDQEMTNILFKISWTKSINKGFLNIYQN